MPIIFFTNSYTIAILIVTSTSLRLNKRPGGICVITGLCLYHRQDLTTCTKLTLAPGSAALHSVVSNVDLWLLSSSYQALPREIASYTSPPTLLSLNTFTQFTHAIYYIALTHVYNLQPQHLLTCTSSLVVVENLWDNSPHSNIFSFSESVHPLVSQKKSQ